MDRAAPRHFSMLRGFHLADFFTLGNAACGAAAIFCAMTSMATRSLAEFYVAAALTWTSIANETFQSWPIKSGNITDYNSIIDEDKATCKKCLQVVSEKS